jgi:hypothetical protein
MQRFIIVSNGWRVDWSEISNKVLEDNSIREKVEKIKTDVERHLTGIYGFNPSLRELGDKAHWMFGKAVGKIEVRTKDNYRVVVVPDNDTETFKVEWVGEKKDFIKKYPGQKSGFSVELEMFENGRKRVIGLLESVYFIEDKDKRIFLQNKLLKELQEYNEILERLNVESCKERKVC